MDEKALLAKIDALERELTRLSRHTDAVEVQNLMSRCWRRESPGPS